MLTWPFHVDAAVDVLHGSIGKGRTYAQTNAGAPILKYRPYVFEVSVQASGSNALNDAWFSPPPFPVPPGVWMAAPFPSVGSDLRYRNERYTTQSSLDSSRINGNYYLRFTTVHDGLRLS